MDPCGDRIGYMARKTLLLVICAFLAYSSGAQTTSGYNTTYTTTETAGVINVPDWTSNNQGKDNTTSKYTVSMKVVAGTRLSFDWSVSCEPIYDHLTVTVGSGTTADEVVANEASGIKSGHYEHVFLGSGSIKIIFTYTKDQMDSYNEDCARCTNLVIDHSGAGQTVIPFKTTTINGGQFASDTQWYQLRKSNSGYLYVEDGVVKVGDKDADPEYVPGYYWCFTGDENGLKIHNFKTGTSSQVSLDGIDAGDEAKMQSTGTADMFTPEHSFIGYNLKCSDGRYLAYSGSRITAAASVTTTTGRFLVSPVQTPEFVDLEKIVVQETLQLVEDDYSYADNLISFVPENTTSTGYTVTSSDESVVYVYVSSWNGSVYLNAQKAGTCTLTFTSTADPSIQAQCQVTVRSKVNVTSITLNGGQPMTLNLGDSKHLDMVVEPQNYDGYISVSSSDTDIAAVDYDYETGGYAVTAVSAGTCSITASSDYGMGVSSTMQVTVTDNNAPHYMAHSEKYVYLRHENGDLTAIPQDFVSSCTLTGSRAQARLNDGQTLTYNDISGKTTTEPEDMPYLRSYKFNNKFNDQLFSDVVADSVSLITEKPDTITLPVGAIGKRLTASFQTSDDQTLVWVADSLQESKHTRQRFAEPIEYRIGREGWQRIELWVNREGQDSTVTLPYGRKLVVNVDWLAARSTTEYGVPRIDINIGGGEWSSTNFINDKVLYKKATIKIDGGGVFPSMDETDMQIKGRGNSSWNGTSSHAKNPYHVKFDEKVRPLGMKAGKHWILLANKQSSSMTTNAIGHRIAQMFDCAAPCHIIPVELYINGSYRGNYNLTERVSIANNSVDLDDDSLAVMLEMDTYINADEPITQPTHYNLSCKLKSPGTKAELPYAETASKSWSIVMKDFDRITDAVYNDEDVDGIINVKKAAKYLAANEYMAQCELKHPKSVYAYTQNPTDDVDETGVDPTPWVFGPIWDCDWAYGYEQSKTYFINYAESDYYDLIQPFYDDTTLRNAGDFWKKLRGYESIDRATYNVWNKFMTEGGLEELIEYCDDYYEFASRSLTHNHQTEATYDTDYNNYATITKNAKSWLRTRAEYIYSKLKPYDPTGITDIVADGGAGTDSQPQTASGDTRVYDIQGRRIQGLPKHGMIIANGHKYVR